MTETMFNWKEYLTKQADKNGSTPLHIAASLTGFGGGYHWTFCRTFPWVLLKRRSGVPIKALVHADPNQLYQADREGSFPIHVAAASGLYSTIEDMIAERPAVAGLPDSKGRTFIHVAVEMGRGDFVANACHDPLLPEILNAQDDDGNTALHLVVKLGVPDIFFSLLMNETVCLDLTNKNGETPLDLVTWSKTPTAGHFYGWNDGNLIGAALRHCEASHGHRFRYNQLKGQEYFPGQKPEDEVSKSNKQTDSTETPIIVPALIFAVTYLTVFTMARKYNNCGTQAPAATYVLAAFVTADAIAFLLSATATMSLLNTPRMAMGSIRRRRLRPADWCSCCVGLDTPNLYMEASLVLQERCVLDSAAVEHSSSAHAPCSGQRWQYGGPFWRSSVRQPSRRDKQKLDRITTVTKELDKDPDVRGSKDKFLHEESDL